MIWDFIQVFKKVGETQLFNTESKTLKNVS